MLGLTMQAWLVLLETTHCLLNTSMLLSHKQ